MLVVVHITTMDTHNVATATEAKVDHMDVRLVDIQALLRGRTAFEKEITRFLEKTGGAAQALRDDVTLSRLVKKIEGVEDDRAVHFEPSEHLRSHPHRKNSGRSNSYNSDDANYTSSRYPTVIPPPPPPPNFSPNAYSWSDPPAPHRRAPSAAYSPYSPRPPMSSSVGAPSGVSMAQSVLLIPFFCSDR